MRPQSLREKIRTLMRGSDQLVYDPDYVYVPWHKWAVLGTIVFLVFGAMWWMLSTSSESSTPSTLDSATSSEEVLIQPTDSPSGLEVVEQDPAALPASEASQPVTPKQVAPAATSGGDCDENYSPCVPKVSYDLNCKDIRKQVAVIGVDVHGLDRDGDGYGCESYN